jgi:hypothetical protein
MNDILKFVACSVVLVAFLVGGTLAGGSAQRSVSQTSTQFTSISGFSTGEAGYGGTYYTVDIQPLNNSLSVTPGQSTNAYFEISSPVVGAFYVAVGQNGTLESPGLISNGATTPLPAGVSASVVGGGIISASNHAVIHVTIDASTSVIGPILLELFVFQHQYQGNAGWSGGYSVNDLTFQVGVR